MLWPDLVFPCTLNSWEPWAVEPSPSSTRERKRETVPRMKQGQGHRGAWGGACPFLVPPWPPELPGLPGSLALGLKGGVSTLGGHDGNRSRPAEPGAAAGAQCWSGGQQPAGGQDLSGQRQSPPSLSFRPPRCPTALPGACDTCARLSSCSRVEGGGDMVTIVVIAVSRTHLEL